MSSESQERKSFYKMKFHPDEGGLQIITYCYVSIHETYCFHFCISEHDMKVMSAFRQGDETEYQCAKRRGLKIYRVHKWGSRIAFETEQQAFLHLRYLKRKQIGHLKRDLDVINRFLTETEGKEVEEFSQDRHWLRARTIPGTQEFVSQYYRFD